MTFDTEKKFSRKTLILHWLVGLTMIALLASGVYMAENKVYALYGWHKSFGIVVFFFALWRVVWRIRNGWPTTLGEPSALMHGLAKLVHYLLLIGTVLMPLSGFIMSVMGGHGAVLFGLELIAQNPDPANPSEVLPLNGTLAGLAHQIHGLAGDLLIIGVLLHVAGAYKHHLFDKDGTLRRMLGQEI